MYVEPDVVTELHLLIRQFYGPHVNCSVKVVLHRLYRGMCYGLFMNKVHRVCIHEHWWLPLTWEMHGTGGATNFHISAAIRKGQTFDTS